MGLLLKIIVAVVLGALAMWVLGLIPGLPEWAATLGGIAVGIAVFLDNDFTSRFNR